MLRLAMLCFFPDSVYAAIRGNRCYCIGSLILTQAVARYRWQECNRLCHGDYYQSCGASSEISPYYTVSSSIEGIHLYNHVDSKLSISILTILRKRTEKKMYFLSVNSSSTGHRTLSTANLAIYFLKMPPGWKGHRLYYHMINQNPCIAQAKPVEINITFFKQ
jgi:hypothetical protein